MKLMSLKSSVLFYLQHICYLVDFFFQQIFGISMDTNRAPLLVGLFLYSYEVDFVHGLLKKNEKKLARSFSFKYFTFRYIDVVLSLNNFKFSDFVDRFLICWIFILATRLPVEFSYGILITLNGPKLQINISS